MAIDPTKVLLIYNTNSDSRIQALNIQNGVRLRDWYAQIRGLTGTGGPEDYYWMGFDFGTANYVTARGASGSYLNAVSIDGANSITCTECSPKIPNQVGVRLSTALKNAGTAGQIEAVLVLPGVPNRVKNTNAAFSFSNYQYIELSLAYAASQDFPDPNLFPAEIPTAQNAVMGPLITDATLNDSPYGAPNGIWRSAGPKPLTSVRKLKTLTGGPCGVACGRIGWTPTDGSEANPDYQYAWGCSTFAQAQAIVSRAIEAENVDNFAKLHVLGGVDYVFVVGQFLGSMAVNRLGISAGLNVSYVADRTSFECQGYGYSENSWWDGPLKESQKPDGWTAAWPPTNKPKWWGGQWPVLQSSPGAQLAQASGYETPGGGGGLQADGGNALTLFGFMSPRMFLQIKNPSNSATFEAGGFTYAWGSPCAQTAEYCLRNGGSLGFGCGGEPGNYSLVDSDVLLSFLLNGYCGAEATLRAGTFSWVYNGANAGWAYFAPDYSGTSPEILYTGTVGNGNNQTAYFNKITAHGDPLYAPYKARNLRPKIMQVGAYAT